MKIKLTILLLLLCSATLFSQTRDFAKWVNPFIGTGGHGHTFPGATMPFGMVQLSPDTRIDNWDGSSGYHYSDDTIYGFSHTHLNGTGIPDYCDILFMPEVDGPMLYRWPDEGSKDGIGSKFSHANEMAGPGYYSVHLDDGIRAEMTATNRVGFHRYTFPKSTTQFANITLNLKWRDKPLETDIRILGTTRIEGFRRSTSWARDQAVYFVAEFSKPFKVLACTTEMSKQECDDLKKLKAGLQFISPNGTQVLVKVGISHVSIEGARKNLAAELPGWDFDKVRADAKAAWNNELSKIEVAGGTDDQTTTFYTALYHTMIQPNIFNDVDGKYLGMDKKIHQLPGFAAKLPYLRRSSASPGDAPKDRRGYAAAFAGSEERRQSREDLLIDERKSTAFPQIDGQSPSNPKSKIRNPQSSQYTIFSLWDTFRAAHPLYTIIDRQRTVDFINTFIRQYEQGGRLPVWELAANETDCMIGYHSVSVIADAMAKGIKGFDYEKAYAAAKHSAELDHFGLAGYKKRGYVSMEDENESVSRTMEYAYDDWCIAQMATRLMLPGLMSDNPADLSKAKLYGDDMEKFIRRSKSYENLFDASTGFMRPKKNGGFVEPFAPNEVTFGFTEGNSWQYSFFVPQDIMRLMSMHGGPRKFASKLDELFTTDQKLAGREQADLTGLIGQYAHGNEPSHHIAYLYNDANEPWKTQKYVRKIMDEFYKPEPDGLIGNEDCGQMSAWYILSASGFYQVTPGLPAYFLGTPLFKEMKYNLENGKTFTVRAPNVSASNYYVRSVKLNGKKLAHPELYHSELINGGLLEFEMSPKPVQNAFVEYRGHEEGTFTAVPVIGDGRRTFQKSLTLAIRAITEGAKVYYTFDGSDPTEKSLRYTGPVTIDANTTVKAVAIEKNGILSQVAEATFIKQPNDWTVKIISPYSTQYTGGGDSAIIDGIRGTVNFASGEWQGVQGKTYEAVIDLQRETLVSEVGASFLQVALPWIWMPDRVEFEASSDGKTFIKIAEIKPGFPQTDLTPTAREYRQTVTPIRARYIRMRAYNFGKIPSWHLGAGGDPWIFVDEVFIR